MYGRLGLYCALVKPLHRWLQGMHITRHDISVLSVTRDPERDLVQPRSDPSGSNALRYSVNDDLEYSPTKDMFAVYVLDIVGAYLLSS